MSDPGLDRGGESHLSVTKDNPTDDKALSFYSSEVTSLKQLHTELSEKYKLTLTELQSVKNELVDVKLLLEDTQDERNKAEAERDKLLDEIQGRAFDMSEVQSALHDEIDKLNRELKLKHEAKDNLNTILMNERARADELAVMNQAISNSSNRKSPTSGNRRNPKGRGGNSPVPLNLDTVNINEREIESAEEHLLAAKMSLSELKNEVDRLTDERQSLKEKLDTYKTIILEEQTESKLIRQKLQITQENYATLEKKNDKMTQHLDDNEKLLSQNKEKLSSVVEERDNNMKIIEALEKEAKKKTSKMEVLEEDLMILKEKLKTVEEHNKVTDDELRTMTIAMSDLEKRCNSYVKQRDEAVKHGERAQSDLDDAVKQLDMRSKLLQMLQTEKLSLQNVNHELVEELQKLRDEHEKLFIDWREKRKQVGGLERSLARVRIDRRHLQLDLEDLKEGEAKKQLERSLETDGLQSDYAQMDKVIKSLSVKLLKLQDEKDELHHQLEETEDSLSENMHSVELLKSENELLKTNNADLLLKLDNCTNELKTYESKLINVIVTFHPLNIKSTITMFDSNTICCIKGKSSSVLQYEYHTPVHRLHMTVVYGGNEVNDFETLKGCGILDGSSVQIIVTDIRLLSPPILKSEYYQSLQLNEKQQQIDENIRQNRNNNDLIPNTIVGEEKLVSRMPQLCAGCGFWSIKLDNDVCQVCAVDIPGGLQSHLKHADINNVDPLSGFSYQDSIPEPPSVLPASLLGGDDAELTTLNHHGDDISSSTRTIIPNEQSTHNNKTSSPDVESASVPTFNELLQDKRGPISSSIRYCNECDMHHRVGVPCQVGAPGKHFSDAKKAAGVSKALLRLGSSRQGADTATKDGAVSIATRVSFLSSLKHSS